MILIMARLTFLTVLVISVTITSGANKNEVLQRWTPTPAVKG